jgi:ubiquinone/menaquinone biosynthesis C-methylase UbiE
MAPLNPVHVLMWTFRRTGRDVVNLYNSLSPVMQLATGGNMLNFGYWKDAGEPVAAQKALCTLVGEEAELGSARMLLDVGSGLAAPAAHWKSTYNLDISCVNINYRQLAASRLVGASLVNATSTLLPFSDSSMDRIIALESAQHFKPLDEFTRECQRVLKPGGLLVMAIPVVRVRSAFFKLGILSFTWSSEHYHLDYVKSAIRDSGLDIAGTTEIGRHVYEPLADYYSLNRSALKEKILQEYPPFLESVLYRSVLKMKAVSQREEIGYAVIKCAAR